MEKNKTLEDVLSAFEDEKSKLADFRALHAQDFEAESAKLHTLEARLASLTQAERRKVLNDADMRHVSAAPPPINPIRSSHTPPKPSTTPKWIIDTTPPDWSLWKYLPEVMLWQAVALSLNLEPDAHSGHGAFNPEDCKTMPPDFHKRLRIAGANLAGLNISRTANNHYTAASKLPVLMINFAGWARSIGWNLPDEFPIMLSEAPLVITAPKFQTAPASEPVKPAEALPRNDRFTVDELAWEIAQFQTDASPAAWKAANGADDDMGRTILSGMNKNGWPGQEPGGDKSIRPGVLPFILGMLERREISVRSTLNNCPPVKLAQVIASPAYWWMTQDDAGKVRAEVLGTPAAVPTLSPAAILPISTPQAAPTGESAPAAWIIKARDFASVYLGRHKEQGLFPSQADVCRYVETTLRENKIFGSHDKPVSAAYIGRNAIQGEWWKDNKP